MPSELPVAADTRKQAMRFKVFRAPQEIHRIIRRVVPEHHRESAPGEAEARIIRSTDEEVLVDHSVVDVCGIRQKCLQLGTGASSQ